MSTNYHSSWNHLHVHKPHGSQPSFPYIVSLMSIPFIIMNPPVHIPYAVNPHAPPKKVTNTQLRCSCFRARAASSSYRSQLIIWWHRASMGQLSFCQPQMCAHGSSYPRASCYQPSCPQPSFHQTLMSIPSCYETLMVSTPHPFNSSCYEPSCHDTLMPWTPHPINPSCYETLMLINQPSCHEGIKPSSQRPPSPWGKGIFDPYGAPCPSDCIQPAGNPTSSREPHLIHPLKTQPPFENTPPRPFFAQCFSSTLSWTSAHTEHHPSSWWADGSSSSLPLPGSNKDERNKNPKNNQPPSTPK